MHHLIRNILTFVIGKDMDQATFNSMFEEVPPALSEQDKRTWLNQMSGVALASDAFFPFRDNIDRARLVRNSLHNSSLLL